MCIIGNLQKILPVGTNKFLPLLVTAIEGQRDPRNLILTFRLMRCSIRKFQECLEYPEQLQLWKNKMFNIATSYFPIQFTPPSKDKIKIKREDLSQLHISAMSATEKLSTLIIPFLLQKIKESSDVLQQDPSSSSARNNSPAPLSKKQALSYLRVCCQKYPGCVLERYAQETWIILQNQVFISFDQQSRYDIINTIAKYCRGLLFYDRSLGELGMGNTPLESSSSKDILTSVIERCRYEVKENPPMSFNVSVCIDLLLGVGLACGCNTTYFIIDQFIFYILLPKLESSLDQFQEAIKKREQPSQAMIESIDIQVCNIGKLFLQYINNCFTNDECFFNFVPSKQQRFIVFLKRALLVNNSGVAQIGIFEMLRVIMKPERPELDDDQRRQLLDFISQFCFKIAKEDLINTIEFREILHSMALENPKLFMQTFFVSHIYGAFERENAIKSFKIIQSVGVELDIFLMSEVSQTLQCTIQQQWECDKCSEIFGSINILWKNLCEDARRQSMKLKAFPMSQYQTEQVKAYISLHEDFTYNCLNHLANSNITPMKIFYDKAKALICTLIDGFFYESSRQRLSSFLIEKCEHFITTASSIKTKRLPIILFKAFSRNVLRIDPIESRTIIQRAAEFIMQFIGSVGIGGAPDFIQNSLLKTVAIISNKCPQVFQEKVQVFKVSFQSIEASHHQLLQQQQQKSARSNGPTQCSLKVTNQELVLIFYIMKGMIARNLNYDVIQQLLKKFKYLDIYSRERIVTLWPILLRKMKVFDNEWEEFKLTVLPFTIQRLFLLSIDTLGNIWFTNSEALNILITTIKQAPQAILRGEIDNILQLLLHGLAQKSPLCQSTSLNSVAALLQNQMIHIKHHFPIFCLVLPFLDPLEKFQNKKNALKCILKLNLSPQPKNIQYFRRAVQNFESLLDDPKRCIRRLSSVCLNRWACQGM